MTPPRWVRSPRWLVLLAGGLPVLAFPAANLEFLAWFGLVPGLLLICRARTAREGGIRGWWFGAGYVIAATWWMAPEIGPGVILIGVVLGFFLVPFGVAVWSLLRPSALDLRRVLAALAVVPSCWLLSEWLRSWQALGGPWAVYGASQWQHPAELALVSVGGVWLLSFALVVVNVSLTILVTLALPAGPTTTSSTTPLRAGTARRSGAAARGVAGVAAGGVVLGVLAGPVVFAVSSPFPVVRHATVALVQPGVVDDPVLRTHASQTLTAQLSRGGSLSGTRPDLIVWGESSIAEDLTLPSSSALLRQLEVLSAQDGADILISQDATPPGKGHEKWAVLVGPDGIKGTYIKTRLVPFGEYVPFRQQLGWLTKISKAASSNMLPGTGARLMYPADRPGGPLPIGVLVCFESAFSDMARVDVSNGAQLLVYQSATSTFQGTWGPDQHASLAAVRAAETGRPAVQAALTGDTVAFDARGRLVAWMGQADKGVVTVRLGLPAATSVTLYDQWGDYVPWTAIGVVMLAALIMLGRRQGFLGGPAGAGDGRTAQYERGQSVPS